MLTSSAHAVDFQGNTFGHTTHPLSFVSFNSLGDKEGNPPPVPADQKKPGLIELINV